MIRYLVRLAWCMCAVAPQAFAQDQKAAPLFAAPSGAQGASGSDAGSLSQVTLALAIVLLAVFAVAAALRYLRRLHVAGKPGQLEVVAQVALGAKERAVIVRVNDVHVLVGVAPGRVNALHTWNAPPKVEEATSSVEPDVEQSNVAGAPSFQALLKKSLGMRP